MNLEKYWEERLSSMPNLKGTGHRGFDLTYNSWLYKTQQDCIIDLLKKNDVTIKDKNVLDVGSGTGFYIGMFQQMQASSITGIDFTETSVNLLRVKFPTHQIDKIDISDPVDQFRTQFDIITAIGLLYHIIDQDRFFQAVINLCNYLKPGGFLFISDTFHESKFLHAKHVKFRSLNEYRSILNSNGVIVLDISPLYYLSNRTIIPYIGPWLQSKLRLGRPSSHIDQRLRRLGIPNFNALKLLLAKRALIP